MRSSSIARTLARPRSICVAAAARLLVAAPRRGIVRGAEQGDQRARRIRRAAQRIDDGHEAEGGAGLAQIAEPGAQPDHRLRLQPGVDHQLVELVVLGRSAQHVGDRALDLAGAREDRPQVGLAADLKPEFVDIALPAAQRGRVLLEHPEAEILEHRHRFRQAGSGRRGGRS